MNLFFAVLLATCATACAATPAARTGKDQGRKGAQPELEVPRTVITPHSGATTAELLAEADALAAAERWAEAAAAYDRVQRLDAEGHFADSASWGAADAHDRAGDLAAALVRYQRVNQRAPDSTRGREALVRAARIAVFLGRFAEAGVAAERLLKILDQLSDSQRIAVLSARALALLDQQSEEQQAAYYIEKARDIVEANRLDAAGRIPRDLAQLYYALGESRRIKAERIQFQPTPPSAEFLSTLEQRCQLLLDAQSAYSDSMRAYDARWSAMAGFRTAELYQKLHRDLFPIAPPPSADSERKRQLFEGAVRIRYGVLLTKARGMAKHTLQMAERTGESSPWVERTRSALLAIDQTMAEEEQALANLKPLSRADFEAYLASLEAKAAPPSPNGKPTRPAQPKLPAQ
jgi:hypothetical protein